MDRTHRRHPSRRHTAKAYLYLAPLLAITAVFGLWPLVASLAMSLYTKYNFLTGRVQALGFGNFTTLWHDADFHRALVNTLLFVVGVVPLTMACALGVALLLRRLPVLAPLLRSVYCLPFVTSTVAITIVWRWLFNRDSGLVNAVLTTRIDWLNDPHWALVALVIVCVWQNLGFNMLLFLIGLERIDPTYTQAAAIDGANAWQRFWHITWPLLAPVTAVVLVTTTIGAFKVFDEVYALFGGSPGPNNAALTLVYYLYQQFYTNNRYPLAAACAVALFALILLVTVIELRWAKQHRAGWEGRR